MEGTLPRSSLRDDRRLCRLDSFALASIVGGVQRHSGNWRALNIREHGIGVSQTLSYVAGISMVGTGEGSTKN
ncbi:UNVERIFIED_CONTAM: hypothetical protein Sradi_7091100 [Sesamum radiatum]|uniref:Uncharacterized protein n=1 Tax=Sesamum radiatum TaxID=300843 RepID=A0AAW2J4P8_SESRA